MATAEVMTSQGPPRPSFKPIIKENPLRTASGSIPFDPEEHLQYSPPSKVLTMPELGYPADKGISPVAVSEPFPLFSQEAIEIMREEVLSDDVWDNCRYTSNLAACQLRGYAPKYARFVYDAWKSPEVLNIMSKVAGVDLIPNIDFEIGNVNISVKSEKQKNEELEQLKNKEVDEFESAVVKWHYDSYPFVCVLMLSDASTMIGGETALRTASGDVLKLRGPQMGCAVVLQGRYIQHQALPALGATERITMVTSFRPRSPFIPDDTVLTTVRMISDLSELYYQFSEYRLEILEDRVREALKQLRERRKGNKKTDTQTLKHFIKEQENFLARTREEMFDEESVVDGHVKPGGEDRIKKRMRIE